MSGKPQIYPEGRNCKNAFYREILQFFFLPRQKRNKPFFGSKQMLWKGFFPFLFCPVSLRLMKLQQALGFSTEAVKLCWIRTSLFCSFCPAWSYALTYQALLLWAGKWPHRWLETSRARGWDKRVMVWFWRSWYSLSPQHFSCSFPHSHSLVSSIAGQHRYEPDFHLIQSVFWLFVKTDFCTATSMFYEVFWITVKPAKRYHLGIQVYVCAYVGSAVSKQSKPYKVRCINQPSEQRERFPFALRSSKISTSQD